MRTLISLVVGSVLALAVIYCARWMGMGRIVTVVTFLTLWLVACVFDA
jgi:hypothetical protein